MAEPTINAVENESTATWTFDSATGYTFSAADVNFDTVAGTISLQDGKSTGYVILPTCAPDEVIKWMDYDYSDSTPTDSTVTYEIQFSDDGGVNWGYTIPYNNGEYYTWTGTASDETFLQSIQPKRNGNDQFRTKITLIRDTNAEPTTGATYYIVLDATVKITNHDYGAADVYNDQMTDYVNFGDGDLSNGSNHYFQVLWVSDDEDGSSPYGDDEYDALSGIDIDWDVATSEPDDEADYWMGVRYQFAVTKGAANTTDTIATFDATTTTIDIHGGIIYDAANVYILPGVEGSADWPSGAEDSDYIEATDYITFVEGDSTIDWQYEQTPVVSLVVLSYYTYSKEPETIYEGKYTTIAEIVQAAGGPSILPYSAVTEIHVDIGENRIDSDLLINGIIPATIYGDSTYTNSVKHAAIYAVLCELNRSGIIKSVSGPVSAVSADGMSIRYSKRGGDPLISDGGGYCYAYTMMMKKLVDRYNASAYGTMSIERANDIISVYDESYESRYQVDEGEAPSYWHW